MMYLPLCGLLLAMAVMPGLVDAASALSCPNKPQLKTWSTREWVCQQPADESTSPYAPAQDQKFGVAIIDRHYGATGIQPGAINIKLHASTSKGANVIGGTPLRIVIPGKGFESRVAQITLEDGQLYGCVEWWSAAGCDGKPVDLYATRRVANVLDYVFENFKQAIDPAMGIRCFGTSMGAHGCYAMLATLPELYRKQFVAIHTVTGFTLTTNADGSRFAPLWRAFTNSDGGRSKASKAVDLSPMLKERHVREVYFTGLFGRDDALTPPNPALFLAVQANRIAHCFIMHRGTHQGAFPGEVQPCERQWVSLGLPLVAFTQSSADQPLVAKDGLTLQAGHQGLGFGMDVRNSVNTAAKVSVPIRYRRRVDVGSGLPDMPVQATVEATLRRGGLSAGSKVSWSYRSQSGAAVVANDGGVTVGLTMDSGEQYHPLVVTK